MRWIQGVISLDLISLLPMACAMRFTFHTTLRFVVFGVLATNLVLGLAWSFTHARQDTSRAAYGIQSRLAYIWVGFNYVAYISVCTTLFKMIAPCEEFDDNSILLKADFRIDCTTSAYDWHRALAWVCIPLYTIGVPAVFLTLLRASKKKDDGSLHTAFLSESYTDDRYFTEPLVCLYKVTAAGLLVFLDPSYAQLLYGIVIAFFWCVVFALLSPFASTAENLVNTSINFCTVLIMMGALSLKLDTSNEQGLAGDLTAGLLWSCTLLPICALVLAIIAEVLFGDAVEGCVKVKVVAMMRFLCGGVECADPPAEQVEDAEPLEGVELATIEGKLAVGAVSEC
jgi:hypothetical protein